MTAAFNPTLPRGRARRGDGRDGAARGPGRAEAGDRPGRVRRVHVPRDARPAADARRLAPRARCAWPGSSSGTSGTTRRRGSTSCPRGSSVAVGPNGEGKTNLLEGIAFLFLLQSPRTSSTEPIVRRGAEAGVRRAARSRPTNGRMLVEVEIPGHGANRVQVNRSPVRRKRDLPAAGPRGVLRPGRPRRRDRRPVAAARLPRRGDPLAVAAQGVRRSRRTTARCASATGCSRSGRGAARRPDLDAWDAELVETGCAADPAARGGGRARLAPPAERGVPAPRRVRPRLRVRAQRGPGSRSRRRSRSGWPNAAQDELIRRTTLVGPHRDDLVARRPGPRRAELREPRRGLGGGALPAARARERRRRGGPGAPGPAPRRPVLGARPAPAAARRRAARASAGRCS